MHIDARAFRQLLVQQVVVDTVGGNRALANRGRQQVGANDVAGDEMPGFVFHLIKPVPIDQTSAVVQFLEPRQVPGLTDRRDY